MNLKNIILHTVLFTSIVSFFVFGIVSILMLGGENVEKVVVEATEYQFAKFNYATNETQLGMVTLLEHLNEDEFIFYDKHNSLHLISNFGVDEYSCSGVCICEEEEEYRRGTSVAFTRGIFTLVAATSSFFAYQKAQEYFDNECVERLSASCATRRKRRIKSDVDVCEQEEVFDQFLKNEGLDTQFEQVKDDFLSKEYFCSGNCQSKPFRRIKPREMSAEARCWKYKTEGTVKVKMDDGLKKGMYQFQAGMNFQKEQLIPYCKRKSPKRSYTYTKGRSGGKIKQTVQLCTGGSRHGEGVNKSIKCRRHIGGKKRR